MPTFENYIEALDALTSLDDADELYVRDDSASADKRITYSSLKTQLDGDFAPLGNPLWIDANRFSISASTPALATILFRWRVWGFDASTSEGVATQILVPENWDSLDIYIWWVNLGAGSGDVRWNLRTSFDAAGATLTGSSDNAATATAGAQNVIVRTQVASGLTAADEFEMGLINVTRDATNVADTLANDAGLLGVEIRRAG